jgi:glycosyltransferase involved in cell wall biosynthesis
MTALISVIVPHLNQPQQLEQCLQSLAAQSLPRDQFDIVVVDNGSRERPQKICDAFGAKLLAEAQPGPGMARNTGIAATTTALLAFIDADCIAHVDWLLVTVAELSKPGTMIIGGDVRIHYVDPGKLTGLEAYESVFAYRQKEYIELKHFSGTGNLAFHRGAFEVVGPFAGIGIAEDKDWGQRAFKANLSIRYVPGMIVWHPARKHLSELKTKWQRHIIHDFAAARGSLPKQLLWMARAAAVAASPLRDVFKVLLSDRLSGSSNRIKAVAVLVRIRFYRAFQMLRLIFLQEKISTPQWNG